MSKKKVNLLIVEDCTIIAEAYKNILNKLTNIDFNILFAKNCSEAVKKIQQIKNQIIILDLNIPNCEEKRLIDGEHLGLFARKESPETKIVVITALTDQARIQSILNELKPEGFLLKSDIDAIELKKAITKSLKGINYFSNTIEKLTKNVGSNGTMIDSFDRQILYHLSMGEKTKDLTKFIPLSTRAIEVRKTKLKNIFDNGNDANFNLVKAAKKRGVI